ncbi:Uncharacterised protein [Rodentibacter pneumotropicus]|uniref:Uncharacterized protein n=1 Tax=Rodentibacter pneumotropicus TaxID=758 RepID=A0A448MMT9_9PAST|nr:Uncharacterised protein [Rodentibacter pneumotropicus]
MFAPLLALPFLQFQLPEMLIWVSCGIEVTMLIFMLLTVKETPCTVRATRFQLSHIRQVLSKRFVLLIYYCLFHWQWGLRLYHLPLYFQ